MDWMDFYSLKVTGESWRTLRERERERDEWIRKTERELDQLERERERAVELVFAGPWSVQLYRHLNAPLAVELFLNNTHNCSLKHSSLHPSIPLSASISVLPSHPHPSSVSILMLSFICPPFLSSITLSSIFVLPSLPVSHVQTSISTARISTSFVLSFVQ